MPFVENACGVRRGLALMNVTAWGALNMTEDVESSLGSGWARKCLASGVRYDEDRLALPAVQWATIGRVQCARSPCRSSGHRLPIPLTTGHPFPPRSVSPVPLSTVNRASIVSSLVQQVRLKEGHHKYDHLSAALACS